MNMESRYKILSIHNILQPLPVTHPYNISGCATAIIVSWEETNLTHTHTHSPRSTHSPHSTPAASQLTLLGMWNNHKQSTHIHHYDISGKLYRVVLSQ